MTNREDVTRNKEALITTSETYLGNPDNNPSGKVDEAFIAELVEFNRGRASEFVAAGEYGKALESLEMARDARSGIITTQVEGTEGSPPVLVRDARACLETPQRGSESAEMQLLNAIRGAIEVAEIEGKPELKDMLARKAGNLMEGFATSCEGLSADKIQSRVKAEMAVVVGILDKGGVDKAAKKLNTAREFQNFNDMHHDVVTISSVDGRDVIEAEVGIRGLTDEQKDEYAAVMDPEQESPGWFTSLPEWHQELVSKHAETIAEGKHTIPTQLRSSIPGMRNPSFKVTAVQEEDGLEVLHESMHAGTLAHLGGSSEERARLTTLNARQAQSFLPEGTTLHTNTLNSRRPGGHDTEIIDRTTAAMESVGGRQTGTAFNLFRLVGGASDTRGATQTLNQLSDSVSVTDPSPQEEAQVASIQSALKPRGFFGRIARGFSSVFSRAPSPQDSIDSLVESGKMSEDVAAALKQGIGLRENVEAASATIRFGDKENVSLEVSTGVNLLTSSLRKINERPEAATGLDSTLVPKEVMLTMCASGKDRTGLAEHDQSARMVADRLGVDVGTVDVALLRGGHTGQVAGSVFAGGGTLGCHGTKSENRAGIPASRTESLDTIVEKSSSGNKIKEPKDKYKESAKEEIEALEAEAAAAATAAEVSEVAAPAVEVAAPVVEAPAVPAIDEAQVGALLGDNQGDGVAVVPHDAETASLEDVEEERGLDDLETRSRGGTVTSREEGQVEDRLKEGGEFEFEAEVETRSRGGTVTSRQEGQATEADRMQAALAEADLAGVSAALKGNTAKKAAQFEKGPMAQEHAQRVSVAAGREGGGGRV